MTSLEQINHACNKLFIWDALSISQFSDLRDIRYIGEAERVCEPIDIKSKSDIMPQFIHLLLAGVVHVMHAVLWPELSLGTEEPLGIVNDSAGDHPAPR